VEDALRIQDEFLKHLTYSIVGSPLTEKIHKEVEAGSQILAVTGKISEKDGVRWISVSRYEPAHVNYPSKILQPDRPLVALNGEPLQLKITDGLTMTCLRLPAGRFLQGSPFYQRRYQDEFPHEVILTRPFFISEIPVTQEIFEAVMRKNPSVSKNPQFPAEHVAYSDILEFCQLLSQRNGLMVRLPTDAEWEYAARVGTSSPCFPEKYFDQVSETGSRPNTTPVKSRKPNAWGLYDMLCGGWHITGDYKSDNVRTKQVDPRGPARSDKSVHRDNSGLLHKTRGGPHYDHIRPNIHGAATENGTLWEAGAMLFRIVVESGPHED
jgi:formylglycine-generating enzyme required for sulfatase activity